MNIINVYFNHLRQDPRVEVAFSKVGSRIDLASDLAIYLTGVVHQLVDGSFRAHSPSAPNTDDGTIRGAYLLGYGLMKFARVDVIPNGNLAYVVMLADFGGDKKKSLERFAGFLKEKYLSGE